MRVRLGVEGNVGRTERSSGGCCPIAVPTNSITPQSVPPVTTQAFVSAAVAESPPQNIASSVGESSKSCAPPVTLMMSSGVGRRQEFSRNRSSPSESTSLPTVMNSAVLFCD